MTPRLSGGARSGRFVALLLVLALLAPLVAWAQQVPGRTLGVMWHEGVPQLYFSARDLANADVRRKLASGLPQTFVMQVYAHRSSDPNAPIAIAAQSCRVTYDIMGETYRVQVSSLDRDGTESVPSLDGVVRRCLEVHGFPIGERSPWLAHSGERVSFAVHLEFNPLSPDTVRRIRHWLANSGGGPVQNDAFFGSFVSLFVNRRLVSAERSLSFQSQPVRVP